MSYFARVSIRDGAHTIVACIDSLLSQTAKPKAIIVVDDGSTDGTGKILEGYGSRIHVINTGNKTRDYTRLAGLLNLSLDYARGHGISGEYHMTTGGDCRFEPDYAEKILAAMDGDPMLAAVSGDYEKHAVAPHGAGRFVRTSFFNETLWRGRYPERIGHESVILYEALRQGYKTKVIQEARFEHLQPLGSGHKFNDWGKDMKAMGYNPRYVWARFASGRPMGRIGALKMLWNYLSFIPAQSGYYSLYEPELRAFISQRQKRKSLVQRIKLAALS